MKTGELNILGRMKNLLNRIVNISAWVPFFVLVAAEVSVPILRLLQGKSTIIFDSFSRGGPT